MNAAHQDDLNKLVGAFLDYLHGRAATPPDQLLKVARTPAARQRLLQEMEDIAAVLGFLVLPDVGAVRALIPEPTRLQRLLSLSDN